MDIFSRRNRYENLNLSLCIIIITLVIYFTYLNREYEVQEGFKGFVRREMKKAKKIITKSVLGQVMKVIKKALKPITGAIKAIQNSMKKITAKIASIAKSIKKGIVDPILIAFKNIALIFVQLGLMVADIFIQIAKLPACVISYVVWVIKNISIQIVKSIIFPMVNGIFKKMFGSFYPKSLMDFYFKFLIKFVDAIFYIFSIIGSMTGLDKVFANKVCFQLDDKLKDRVKKIRNLAINSGKSFGNFGKFK